MSATPKPSVLTPKIEDFPVGASPYASGQPVRQMPIRPITGRSPAALAASERLLTFDPKVPVTLDYRERQEAVSVLLGLQDYDALDCVADTLRQKKLHGRGGDWLLHQFYDVLIEAECSGAEWLSKNKQSVTAHVVAGKYFVNQAWKVRGGGFAETVSEEGWKGFKQNLEQAQAVLLAGLKLEGDPELNALLITCSKGLQRDPKFARQQVDLALKIAPDDFEAPEAYCDFLLPRWGGDIASYQAFVEEMVAKTKKTMGQSAYFRLNQQVWRRPGYEKEIGLDRKRFQKALEDQLRYLPNSRPGMLGILQFYYVTDPDHYPQLARPYIDGPQAFLLEEGERLRLLAHMGQFPQSSEESKGGSPSYHDLLPQMTLEQITERLGKPIREFPAQGDGTILRQFRPSFSTAPPCNIVFGPDGGCANLVRAPELTINGSTLPYRTTFDHVRQQLGAPTYYWISTTTGQFASMVYSQFGLAVEAERGTDKVSEYRMVVPKQLPGNLAKGYLCSRSEFESLVLHGTKPEKFTIHPAGKLP